MLNATDVQKLTQLFTESTTSEASKDRHGATIWKGNQKRPQNEAKRRPKSAKGTKMNQITSARRRKGGQEASKGTKTGPNENHSTLKVRKVAKRILPGSAETESYSRKTKVFTFDGDEAGCLPGAVGRSTRQIRGGPS